MGRIGFPELIIVLAMVLILFGPKKLPELARGLGESVKEFRKGQEELDKTINQPVMPENQKTTSENAPTVQNATQASVEEDKKEN